jgi:hypothetical protein
VSAADFPGLDDAGKRAEKAVTVLQSAIDHALPRDGEALVDVATRLRGAAVLAHSAGLELAMVSGIHTAANDASEAGMLDGEERGDGR